MVVAPRWVWAAPRRLEKNYTYWVYGGLELFQEGGYLRVALSSKKEHVQDILKVIEEEIERLRATPLSDAEMRHHVTAAKAHIVKNYLAPERMLWWYGWNILSAQRVSTMGEYLREFDHLTPEAVLEAARTYLDPGNIHMAALGQIDEADLAAAA